MATETRTGTEGPDQIVYPDSYSTPVLVRGLGGDDTIRGGIGADTLDGGDGNDTLSPNFGDDVMYGGAGDDRFGFGVGAHQYAYGGSGTDTAVLTGDIGGYTYSGTPGSFTVTEIWRGFTYHMDGIEFIQFRQGAAMSPADIPGLGGPDYFTVTGTNDADTLGTSGGDLPYLVQGAGGDDYIAGSQLSGLDPAGVADTLIGDTGNDTIIGAYNHADIVIGTDGDDLLISSHYSGIDEFHGGTGVDTLSIYGDMVDVTQLPDVSGGDPIEVDISFATAGVMVLRFPRTGGEITATGIDFLTYNGRLFAVGADSLAQLDIVADNLHDAENAPVALGDRPATGTIETAGDADLYAVTLGAGFSYRFDLQGETLRDVRLTLLDANGAVLAVNDDTANADGSYPQGVLDSRIEFTAPAAGTYYLSVDAVGDGTGDYTIGNQLIGTPIPAGAAVYRFYNQVERGHFFTADAKEADYVTRNLDRFTFEGIAFHEPVEAPSEGLTDVYRFYNTRAGGHFFTADAAERDSVIANLGDIFRYEGVGFQADADGGEDLLAVHRFYNTVAGGHLFTTSEEERDHVTATLPQYDYEGVAYYMAF